MITVRRARPSDHATYARLFRELRVDDAIFDEPRFERDMMPTTVVAEQNGYAHFIVIGDTTHVSQIAVAPPARRTGVGRALMQAIAERARDAGCKTWRLNVRPDNAPALALYEGLGMSRAFESLALRIEWRVVADGPNEGRLIEPAEDERVERAMRMLPGQLAQARATNRRVVGVARRDEVVAAAVFDPAFPGASVFRAASAELAVALLRALKPYALPEHDFLGVKVEDDPEIADALLALGARLRFRMIHMAGPLPHASTPR